MPVLGLSAALEQNIGFGWPLGVVGYVEIPKHLAASPPAPVVTITPVSVNTRPFTFNTTVIQPPYLSTDTSSIFIFYLYIKSTDFLAAEWHFPSGRYMERVTHTMTARLPSYVEDDPGKSVPYTTILNDPPLGRQAPVIYRREDDIIKPIVFKIDGPKTITSFPVTFNISDAKPNTRVGLVMFSKFQAGQITPQGWGAWPSSIISAEEGPITDSNGSAQLTVKEHLGNGLHILQAYYEVQEPFGSGPGLPITVPATYCSFPLQVEVNAPEPPPSKPPPTPAPAPIFSQILTSLMAIAFLGLVPALLKPKKRASPR